MRRPLAALIPAAGAALLLAACSSPAQPAPARTVTATPVTSADAGDIAETEGDTATPSLDPRKLTELAVTVTWDSTSDADKTSICDGIALFGPDWAARQLQGGSSDTSSIDWDYAAILIQDDCQQR